MTTTIEAPLQMPNIPTTETQYDTFKRNRMALINQLANGGYKQLFNEVSNGQGGFCFVGVAQHTAESL